MLTCDYIVCILHQMFLLSISHHKLKNQVYTPTNSVRIYIISGTLLCTCMYVHVIVVTRARGICLIYRKSKIFCVKRSILKLSYQKTFVDHVHREHYEQCSLTAFKLNDMLV